MQTRPASFLGAGFVARSVGVLSAALALHGCYFVRSPGGNGVACTDLAAASVGVTVNTADGGSLDGLSVTYSVNGVDQGACTDNTAMNGGEWICGYEQRGHIEVTASLPGYDTVTQSVDVGADECHVIQELVDVTLEPSAVACDDMAYASVLVHLYGFSGETLQDPAVTWAVDGGQPTACDTDDAGATWQCGWEVPGDFRIAATASGHQPGEATVTVPLSDDGCHVVTQEVDIGLDWGAD